MKKFKPKPDENYWMINSRWEVKQAPNTGSKKSQKRIKAGNCFKTELEADLFLARSRYNLPMKWWEHLAATFGLYK